MNKTWQYERGLVCIDDPGMEGEWAYLVPPTKAIVVKNDRWNGWMIPFFEKAEADAVMAAWNALAEGPFTDEESAMTFDAATDTYTVAYPEDPEATETYEGEDIEFDGQTVHVYGLGACGWVWEAPPVEGKDF